MRLLELSYASMGALYVMAFGYALFSCLRLLHVVPFGAMILVCVPAGSSMHERLDGLLSSTECCTTCEGAWRRTFLLP